MVKRKFVKKKQFKRKFRKRKGKKPKVLNKAQGIAGPRRPPEMLIYKGVGDICLPPQYRFITRCNWSGFVPTTAFTAGNFYFTKTYLSGNNIYAPFLMPTGYNISGTWTATSNFPLDSANRCNGFRNLINANCYQAYRVLSSRLTIKVQPVTVADCVMAYIAPMNQLQQGSGITNNEPGYLQLNTIQQGPRVKKMMCNTSSHNTLVCDINQWDLCNVTKQVYMNDNSAQRSYNQVPGGSGSSFPTGIYETYWQVALQMPGNTNPADGILLELFVEYYVQAEDLQYVSILD